MAEEKIMVKNVMVIEDHPEFRESLFFILQSNKGFKCCGKFSSLESVLLSKEQPDVILLDINLPGISGIEGIPDLRESFPDTAILMLTVLDDNESIFRAILAGADGYLLKTTPPIRLLQAIEDAAIGGCPMSPLVARQAMNFFRKHVPPVPKEYDLTEREKEILQLVIEGFNNEDIASKLFISIQTVRNHIRHIYEKLHVHSRSQAVVKAIRENLI
jgi:DNA-binding NarL/FixJ family response regulator